MKETRYHGTPNTITAITSMSSLLVGERFRREVRLPRRDELPANVAWLRDENNADFPAIIGMTGRVTHVRDIEDARVSQWNVSCFPNDPIVHERLSQRDAQDIVGDLHKELTGIGVMPGAWYTAYFSVPMYGGNNFFECSFECAGFERRRQEKVLRASLNPYVIFRRAFGLVRPMPDPWLDDMAIHEAVARAIRNQGSKILGIVWDKWSRSPKVKPTLSMLRVPLDPNQTVYKPGYAHQRIFANVPKISRQTMFGAGIPDDFEEEIARKIGGKA